MQGGPCEAQRTSRPDQAADGTCQGKQVVFKGLSLPFHVLQVESQVLWGRFEGIMAVAGFLRATTQASTGLYQVRTGVLQVSTSLYQVHEGNLQAQAGFMQVFTGISQAICGISQVRTGVCQGMSVGEEGSGGQRCRRVKGSDSK
jgi:hypothetical protein